ncbi:MAG: hypothetical protein ABR963_07250, partial [Acidimicrobiales bacterium]
RQAIRVIASNRGRAAHRGWSDKIGTDRALAKAQLKRAVKIELAISACEADNQTPKSLTQCLINW